MQLYLSIGKAYHKLIQTHRCINMSSSFPTEFEGNPKFIINSSVYFILPDSVRCIAFPISLKGLGGIPLGTSSCQSTTCRFDLLWLFPRARLWCEGQFLIDIMSVTVVSAQPEPARRCTSDHQMARLLNDLVKLFISSGTRLSLLFHWNLSVRAIWRPGYILSPVPTRLHIWCRKWNWLERLLVSLLIDKVVWCNQGIPLWRHAPLPVKYVIWW